MRRKARKEKKMKGRCDGGAAIVAACAFLFSSFSSSSWSAVPVSVCACACLEADIAGGVAIISRLLSVPVLGRGVTRGTTGRQQARLLSFSIFSVSISTSSSSSPSSTLVHGDKEEEEEEEEGLEVVPSVMLEQEDEGVSEEEGEEEGAVREKAGAEEEEEEKEEGGRGEARPKAGDGGIISCSCLSAFSCGVCLVLLFF